MRWTQEEPGGECDQNTLQACVNFSKNFLKIAMYYKALIMIT